MNFYNGPKVEPIVSYLDFLFNKQGFYFYFNLIMIDPIILPQIYTNIHGNQAVFGKQTRGMFLDNVNSNDIILNSNLGVTDLLLTFAHEYEHLIQNVSGNLEFLPDGNIMYKGTIYNMYCDYNIVPWELDAKRSSFDKVLAYDKYIKETTS